VRVKLWEGKNINVKVIERRLIDIEIVDDMSTKE